MCPVRFADVSLRLPVILCHNVGLESFVPTYVWVRLKQPSFSRLPSLLPPTVEYLVSIASAIFPQELAVFSDLKDVARDYLLGLVL